MKNSPLQLEASFLDEISLSPGAIQDDEGAESLTLEVNPSFGHHNTDDNRWKVTLAVRFKGADGKPAAFSGHITMTGLFLILASQQSVEAKLKLVAVNGPSILFAAAREIVAGLTSRSSRGVFHLPSVSFADTQVPEELVKKLKLNSEKKLKKEGKSTSIKRREQANAPD